MRTCKTQRTPGTGTGPRDAFAIPESVPVLILVAIRPFAASIYLTIGFDAEIIALRGVESNFQRRPGVAGARCKAHHAIGLQRLTSVSNERGADVG